MMPQRLTGDEHCDGAVTLRVGDLGEPPGVDRMPGAVEDGPRIVLLRFMVEHEDDAAADVEVRVVVVVVFRRRNSVAGEDHLRTDADIAAERAREVRARAERLRYRTADDRQFPFPGIRAVGDERKLLQE
jgi:hypothetical protein